MITVPQVCLVQVALKATRDLLGQLVPLESPDMESQDLMERRERGDLQVSAGPQVPRVRKVQQDILVLLVPLDQLVPLDLRVQLVSQVSMALLAPKVTQV